MKAITKSDGFFIGIKFQGAISSFLRQVLTKKAIFYGHNKSFLRSLYSTQKMRFFCSGLSATIWARSFSVFS